MQQAAVAAAMNPKFAKLAETLAPKLDELLAMKPLRHGSIPMALPMKGVYLFSKGDEHRTKGPSPSRISSHAHNRGSRDAHPASP